MHSSRGIETWVEQCLKILLPETKGPVKFRDLILPTYVVATDLATSDVKVWSADLTPDDSVARAVRASASIPLFFQPVDGRYVDGGIISNLPSFVFSNHEEHRRLSSKVLAFSLVTNLDNAAITATSGVSYYYAIADAVVDGAKKLQGMLQPEVHTIHINTGDVKATDFERMTPNIARDLISKGREATRLYLDEELINTRKNNILIIYDSDRRSYTQELLR